MNLPDLRRLRATIAGAHKQAVADYRANPGGLGLCTIADELTTMRDCMERLMQAAESAPVSPQTN
jgi:hypothetical protein